MKPYTAGALVLPFLISFSAAQAAPPDAGQLLREQQPQRQMPRQLPTPEAEKERPPLSDSGVRVVVKGFTFSGIEGLATESELQALVADAVGKSLSFSELQGLAAKVTAHLKDKGWFLAKAYLPKQDITSGVIEIAVIQGKSDGLIIRRDKSARISEKSISSIAQKSVRHGQPINEQCLERSALLINDLPGVTAKASLAQGSTPGTTSVQLDVSEGPLLSGAIWGDNQGNRYTGAWRGNSLLSINDPLGYGDQLSLLITGAEGLILGRAGYLFPLASNGLKGNLTYTGMGYEIVEGETEVLKQEGDSHIIDAGLSYPILRSRTANVTTSIGYEFKKLTDSISDVDTRDKTLHSGTVSFMGDKYDTFLGGGYTTWNAGATTGTMDEKIADIAITKKEGSYTRFNFGLARLQRLIERTTLNLSYSGQLSLDNLDTSEQFYLGGPYGIRAYPVGEASGDEGHLFNVDLRYDLPLPASIGLLQLNGFYDAGWIRLYKDTWPNSITTISNRNDYWLQGAGFGLNYAYNDRISLKATWAHTVGDNQGRSISGRDADGRSDDNRFWLQAMLFF
ncbi:ShlB/FhaC/HecB family hemolysin secretion/activation protein [Geobacter sp.]|uniref:ShlB/FhaC/HecB family hemolysin secretion/activation protein n=1 Tax=Geobacter sp. TaxID=46610 RepID=UPI0027B8F190|nr:ShlB/FhaC/HecB family hemolysin secretion/activation protein [Geobacter sp.]